jgi:hypothetical protein
MRKDMYRVVTERPRQGSRMRNRKSGLTIRDFNPNKDYALPLRDSMSRTKAGVVAGNKDFTDRIGPLRRYLRSMVGRPWDKVYSDIRRVIKANATPPISHIWDIHIKGEVELNCILGDDGKIYPSTYHMRYIDREVYGFYVHPISKTLEYIPYRSRRKDPEPPHSDLEFLGRKSWDNFYHDKTTGESFEEEVYRLKGNPYRKYARLKGIWYVLEYKDHNPNELVRVYDKAGFPMSVRRKERPELPIRFMSRKRQMNSKELRRFNLKNTLIA